jgi:formate hydrogenlyase subunit 6/NADH:ubiquinone oxidoreductase subunit I
MILDQRGVRIDYHRCIRCFCCQELCPHGAVRTRQGSLLRVAAFLGGRH